MIYVLKCWLFYIYQEYIIHKEHECNVWISRRHINTNAIKKHTLCGLNRIRKNTESISKQNEKLLEIVGLEEFIEEQEEYRLEQLGREAKLREAQEQFEKERSKIEK